MSMSLLARCALAIFAWLASPNALVHAQIVGGSEAQVLHAFDATANDEYGQSVALSGDTLAVGAWMDTTSIDQDGSVHVYVRGGSGAPWLLQQKIAPSFASGQFRFGETLALEGDRLVVGASWDGQGQYQSGAVYVYERVGTTWTQTVKLKGTNIAFNRNLGVSVALDGDTIAAGATYACCASSPPGFVYVFRNVAGTWTQETILTGLGTQNSDAFGDSVSLDGDRLAVGAPRHPFVGTSTAGSAHVFERVGSTWTQTQRIDAPVFEVAEHFGIAVALDGTTLAVGAHDKTSADGSQPESGRVDVFSLVASTWTHVQGLVANDATDRDQFGAALALEGDVLVAGAPTTGSYSGVPNRGSFGGVYVFEQSGGAWSQTAKLVASKTESAGRLGASLALEGDTLIAGAPSSPFAGARTGGACSFTLPVNPIGTTFCVGDGSNGPCPCANDSTSGAQLGCENGQHRGAWIVAAGSASASLDDLAFEVHGASISTVALFASTVTQSPAVFGGGLRCLAGGQLLVSKRSFDGSARFGPGLGASGGWIPGQTRSFQALYRARFTPGCHGSSNASSGVQVTFTP